MGFPRTPSREVKVQLPARLATALHANKILTGRPIGLTVEEALRAYYAAEDAREGASLELRLLTEA